MAVAPFVPAIRNIWLVFLLLFAMSRTPVMCWFKFCTLCSPPLCQKPDEMLLREVFVDTSLVVMVIRFEATLIRFSAPILHSELRPVSSVFTILSSGMCACTF